MDGSEGENCADDGQCACKEHVSGSHCDECEAGYSMNGFPTCQVSFFLFFVHVQKYCPIQNILSFMKIVKNGMQIECIFSRNSISWNWVFPRTSSYSSQQDKCPLGTSPVELYERVLGRTSSMILSSWKRHSQTYH